MLEIAKRVDAFMMERSPVHDTMRRLAKAFGELDIAFAIAGAMAGQRAMSSTNNSDVDVLVRREDLTRFKIIGFGRGWVDLFERFKGFKDTQNGVKVDVLVVGDYPVTANPNRFLFPLRKPSEKFATKLAVP